MRVRRLSPSGDMTFGHGSGDFLVDDAAAVAQCVRTRLGLWEGEWFLNQAAGTPWLQQVIGKGTRSQYDAAIQLRILETPGVMGITSYSSSLDDRTRTLTIEATIQTQFGPSQLLLGTFPFQPGG